MNIIRKILAPFRILFFFINIFLVYFFYSLFYIPGTLLGLNTTPWRNRCLMTWGKISLWILSIDIRVHGKPPEPPFFIVSNHLSYLDIVVYAAVLKTTFVSKAEIKQWPIIGYMARSLGIIFINRRVKSDVHRVNNEISKKVNENQGVLFFPEATTSPGKEILPFRPSLLEHAVSVGEGVHFSALRYETSKQDLPAYRSVCWWDDMPIHKHFYTLTCNKKIYADITFGNQKICNEDRKILAKNLESEVRTLFNPVTTHVDDDFKPMEF